MLLGKAKDLGKLMNDDFNPSPSWIQRWRERNLIVFKRQHGKRQDHDSEAAEHWLTSVWPRIQDRYAASEIYNCDETGIYYRVLPEGTKCFKIETLFGGKKSKERLTVLLTSNMDGSDTRKLLVVGKSATPRCFRGVKTLPVTHCSNSISYMTSTLFQQWIESFDASLVKKGKKVCLLLDSCSACKIEDSALKCIELAYLPPNTTSFVQPLDQGIIKNFLASLSAANATKDRAHN